MAEVKYRDVTIITDAQGVWRLTPGMMRREWVMVRMPRGIGEIAKDMGLSGCDHQLSLSFLNVSESDVDNTFESLQELWTPESGSPKSGTLVVPDYGTYPHCVITDCTPGEQTPVATGIDADDPVGERCYDLHFQVTFRQLRR